MKWVDSEQKSEGRVRRPWWPTITDRTSARRAAGQAAALAGFQAAVITAIVLLNTFHVTHNLFGLNLGALCDVAILLLLGWLIYWRLSRIAAVLALVYSLAVQQALFFSVLFFSEQPPPGVPPHPGLGLAVLRVVIFSLLYVNGIRGTFAYHAYSTTGRASLTATEIETEILSWVLPKTADRDGARRAGLHGVALALLALFYGLATFYSASSDEFLGLIFMLGILMPAGALIYWRMSRLAALAQLALLFLLIFLGLQDYLQTHNSDPVRITSDPVSIIGYALFLFLSANAVRGTFACRRLGKAKTDHNLITSTSP